MSSPCSPDVVRWRTERVFRLGFTGEEAAAIAADVLVVGETRDGDAGVDLHALERLLALGCPRELARRIF